MDLLIFAITHLPSLLVLAVVGGLVYLLRRRLWNLVLLLAFDSTDINLSFYSLLVCACFNCCGLCTGEWTANLTNISCLEGRWRWWHRRNLVYAATVACGLAQEKVRVKGIVVANLDHTLNFNSYADLFVEFTASSDSNHVSTEVVKNASLKCTQFLSSLTVSLRNSWWRSTTINVYANEIVGSRLLASAEIPNPILLEWAEHALQGKRQFKRIRLDVKEGSSTGFRSSPWVFFEVDPLVELESLRINSGEFKVLIDSTRSTPEDGCEMMPQYDDQRRFEEKIPEIPKKLPEILEKVQENAWKYFRVPLWAFCWCAFLLALSCVANFYTSICYEKMKQLTVVHLSDTVKYGTDQVHTWGSQPYKNDVVDVLEHCGLKIGLLSQLTQAAQAKVQRRVLNHTSTVDHSYCLPGRSEVHSELHSFAQGDNYTMVAIVNPWNVVPMPLRCVEFLGKDQVEWDELLDGMEPFMLVIFVLVMPSMSLLNKWQGWRERKDGLKEQWKGEEHCGGDRRDLDKQTEQGPTLLNSLACCSRKSQASRSLRAVERAF